MQTHEYAEAVTDEALDTAVRRLRGSVEGIALDWNREAIPERANLPGQTMQSRFSQPEHALVESTGAALYARAAEIVDELFCPCVTDAEDAAEGGRSSIHEGLISEILRRAGRRT
ncbi:MAG: hypothetical protein ACREFP_03415 [Acetobacteraceae bacterium]